MIANIITESMHTQCDADRNEYLLLVMLVDYGKDNKVISLTDQQTSIWGKAVICKATIGD